VRQVKAFCQFENRYIRNISISLVTEDFFQKENVLEYSLCRCFLVTPSHRNLLIHPRQIRFAVTEEGRAEIIGTSFNNPPLACPLSFEQTICPLLKNLLF
jgi:hypothetical protein